MLTVSATFVRAYRRRFLKPNGLPKPGKEQAAQLLLDVLKLIQGGCVWHAVDMAWEQGLDLPLLYRRYIASIRRRYFA